MTRDYDMRPVLVGAAGRVGTRIARTWRAAGQGFATVSSRPGADVLWDMAGPAPRLPAMAGQTVIVLAGATPGPGVDLGLNAARARAGVAAARDNGAAHCFVVSSSAVYGATGPAPVAEDAPCAGTSGYARAKTEMERATAGPGVTILRLANVAGVSQPFLALQGGGRPVLDRFADGAGPSRSFVGPGELARILSGLCAAVRSGRAMPGCLNVAGPAPVAMADLFLAVEREIAWRDAPDDAVQHVHLDSAALAALVAPRAQDAAALWADARATEVAP